VILLKSTDFRTIPAHDQLSGRWLTNGYKTPGRGRYCRVTIAGPDQLMPGRLTDPNQHILDFIKLSDLAWFLQC
jgi:hypothetical protein